MKKILFAIAFLLIATQSHAITNYCEHEDIVMCHVVEDGSGTTLTDESSNSVDGTLKGGIPTWDSDVPSSGDGFDGVSTYSLDFDGSTDRVCGSALSVTNDVTIVVWAKANTSTWDNYAKILGEPHQSPWGNPYIRYAFSRNNNTTGGQWAHAYSSSAYSGTTSANGFFVGSEWHHYAVTRSGTTVKYYKDGVLFETDTSLNSGDIDAGNSYDWCMGNRSDLDSGEAWGGNLDELAVFDSVLLEATILDIAQNGLVQVETPDPPVITGTSTKFIGDITTY